MAVYAGSPLAQDELPERLPDPVRSEEVRFRSERIGAYRLFPAPDPTGDTAGPTVSHSRSATWDIYRP